MQLQVVVQDLVILLITRDTLGEVAEDQVFGVLLLEVLGEVVLGEGLLDDVTHELLVGGDVLVGDQSIAVGSFTFMDP